jgi:hypothetical protein
MNDCSVELSYVYRADKEPDDTSVKPVSHWPESRNFPIATNQNIARAFCYFQDSLSVVPLQESRTSRPYRNILDWCQKASYLIGTSPRSLHRYLEWYKSWMKYSGQVEYLRSLPPAQTIHHGVVRRYAVLCSLLLITLCVSAPSVTWYSQESKQNATECVLPWR